MEEDEENSTLDPELWLQTTLAMRTDKERWDKLVQSMSEKSGVSTDKIEEVLQTLIKILMEKTGRAN